MALEAPNVRHAVCLYLRLERGFGASSRNPATLNAQQSVYMTRLRKLMC